tara:strand:+ start:146 stop:595 length:450 start_codon:yes stop_codon:yes gene_type:complete
MFKKEKLEPIDILNEYLNKKGLRKTPERNIILEEIYKLNTHFDIDELFNIISKKNKISKATVYNTIELLNKLELVKKHSFNDTKIVYEKSLNKKQHNHLICVKCNKIQEFCDPRLQNIIDSAESLLKFKISKHSLNFYGHCLNNNCENK